ncbi:MAG: tetratricopeptide repeat protein, partial [Myxococcota bacterium]
EVDGHGGARRRRLLEQETENLLTVVRAGLATEPLVATVLERALRGLLVLEPVLSTRGPFQVHLMLLDAGLSAPAIEEVDVLLRAQVLESRGRVRRARGLNEESLADLEHALRLARTAGDEYWVLRTLANIGTHHVLAGQLSLAEAIYDEIVPLMRRVDDRRLEGRSYSFLGTLRRRQGLLAEAQSCYERALVMHRQEGDRRYEGITLGELATMLIAQRKGHEGARLLEEALSIHQEVGNKRFEGTVLHELARLRLEEGQLDDAQRHATQALSLYRDVIDRAGEGRVRTRLGEVLARQHRLEDAREQFDRAAALFQRSGETVETVVCLTQCATVEAALGHRALAQASYEDAAALAAPLADPVVRRALDECRAFLTASAPAPESALSTTKGSTPAAAGATARSPEGKPPNLRLLQAAMRKWKALRRPRPR